MCQRSGYTQLQLSSTVDDIQKADRLKRLHEDGAN